MSLHLIDLLLINEPKNKEWRSLKGSILTHMSIASKKIFFTNFYKGNTQIEMEHSNENK